MYHINDWTLLSSSLDEQEDIPRICSRKSRACATQDEVQNVVSVDRNVKGRFVLIIRLQSYIITAKSLFVIKGKFAFKPFIFAQSIFQ